jgi:hypothetical protein
VTKKKIFDLDPRKVIFYKQTSRIERKQYFLNLRRNNEKKKNGGKVKLYFTLERKAAVQSIVPLHSYL